MSDEPLKSFTWADFKMKVDAALLQEGKAAEDVLVGNIDWRRNHSLGFRKIAVIVLENPPTLHVHNGPG